MATDDLDDTRVLNALGRLLAAGEPFTALPLVDPATKLFPSATMDVLDGRYPSAAEVSDLEASVTTQAETLTSHGADIDGLTTDVGALETLTTSGRLSTSQLSNTIGGAITADVANPAGVIPAAIGGTVERATPQISAERPRASTAAETNLLVVFIDDDGRSAAWSTLRPFYQSKNVPVGWAITTDLIGTTGHMTWDQVRTLATDVTSDGKKSEILNHSKTHASLTSADLALATAEIETPYNTLVSQGLNPEGYVWTYTDSNTLAAQVVRKHHRYAFGGIAGGGGTGMPIWTYAMGRQLINSTSTLATLKANFDGRSSGVLVYFTHSTDIPSTSILSDFIDYIRARANCEIVSPNEAMSRYANVQDIGNRPWAAGYRVVSRDGKVVSDLDFARSGGTGSASVIALNWTDFGLGITIHAITTGGPGSGNGTLETIVTAATQNGYAVQRFYEYGAPNSGRGGFWLRQSTGSTSWSGWRRVIVDQATGTAAPTSTPLYIGQTFVDTTNKKVYAATGTASSADWTVLN